MTEFIFKLFSLISNGVISTFLVVFFFFPVTSSTNQLNKV